MTEQEKFEAMFSDPSVDKTKRHGRPDQYKDLTTNLLWEGWQAAIASREPMTEVEAMQIVSTRPYGTLVNSLHYAIRETERFHGIGD